MGVFVNRPAEEVERIVATCGIDLIQLHGDESPDYCRRFPAERIIKAVSPKTAEELRRLEEYAVRAFLADARDAGRYGGTGKRADWELAARIGERHPLILAGGLDAESIGPALAAVAPCAVDINSGCERSPGIKDHGMMQHIVGMVRDMPLGKIHARGMPGPSIIFAKSATRSVSPPWAGGD